MSMEGNFLSVIAEDRLYVTSAVQHSNDFQFHIVKLIEHNEAAHRKTSQPDPEFCAPPSHCRKLGQPINNALKIVQPTGRNGEL